MLEWLGSDFQQRMNVNIEGEKEGGDRKGRCSFTEERETRVRRQWLLLTDKGRERQG